jgi:hypothetical protein
VIKTDEISRLYYKITYKTLEWIQNTNDLILD